MDIWLLLCMTFVTLATFEYALLLAILFDKREKIHFEMGTTEMKARTCNKVDRISFILFVGTYILTIIAYFVIVTQMK